MNPGHIELNLGQNGISLEVISSHKQVDAKFDLVYPASTKSQIYTFAVPVTDLAYSFGFAM